MKNTLTEVDGRFAGVIGREYSRLLKAMPHIPLMEKAIAVNASAVLHSEAEKPGRILDLGCGTGMTTLALSEEVKHVTIVAVDKEPTMLKQFNVMLQQQAASLHERGIAVEVIEGGALEFLKSCQSDSFDVVVSGFVMHNLTQSDRLQILKEIGRVLRPQGRFVNSDKVARDDKNLHDQDLMEQIAAFVRCYSSPEDVTFGLEWIEHYVRDNQPDLKQTESEVRESLSQAGFGNIRIFERHAMDAVVTADRLP